MRNREVRGQIPNRWQRVSQHLQIKKTAKLNVVEKEETIQIIVRTFEVADNFNFLESVYTAP